MPETRGQTYLRLVSLLNRATARQHAEMTPEQHMQAYEGQVTELATALGLNPMGNKDHAFDVMEAISGKHNVAIREAGTSIDVVVRQANYATK